MERLHQKITSEDSTSRLHNCGSEIVNVLLDSFPSFFRSRRTEEMAETFRICANCPGLSGDLPYTDRDCFPLCQKMAETFPFSKRTAAHDVKNATGKKALLLYSPLVKKSATYMKLFPKEEKRRTMRTWKTWISKHDYGRGLEMSEKQAKGIEKQEKLAQLAEVQTVKEKKRKSENNKCCRCRVNYSHKGTTLSNTEWNLCKHCHRKAISQKYMIQKQIKFHEH